MKKIKEYACQLSLLLSIPALKSIYLFLNRQGKYVRSLVTDIDRDIPFIKEFIIPYMVWYFFVFIVLTYFCLKDRKTYHCALISINISILICYCIYIIYQTTVPRPVLYGGDLLTKLVGFIYSIDRPYNCFPSIHTLTSFILIKAINRSTIKSSVNFSIITGIAVSIILSTFFIKQHVMLDAISAMFLGGAVFEMVSRLKGERILLWLKRQYSSLTMRKKLGT